MAEKLRLMLVDDDPSIADILTPVLSDNNYEVVVASSGEEALELTPRAEPDIFLVDVMMPGMDGFELTKHIRQMVNFQFTPIVFLSALDSRKDIQKAYTLGVTVYLTKPVSVNRLLKNLQVFVQNDKLQARPKKHKLHELEKPAAPPPPPPIAAAPPRPKPAAVKPRPMPAPRPAPPPQPTPSPTPMAYSAPPQLPRVMIVEDDLDIIDVMTSALDQHFEVVKANDGLDAIRKIETLEPDMFIVDLMMPRLNGYQLIHALRNTSATKDMPVLVVSAKSSRADQKHAISLGANDFLPKPFQPGELIERLFRLTQLPDFHIISPKKMSQREIIERETRLRIEEEEKKMLMDLQRKVIEEKQADPFGEEEHIRRKNSELKTDFTDLKNLFKPEGKGK